MMVIGFGGEPAAQIVLFPVKLVGGEKLKIIKNIPIGVEGRKTLKIEATRLLPMSAASFWHLELASEFFSF